MKKIIFALFPFALLFGKTEIRLQTIDEDAQDEWLYYNQF
jgi:hypothetical protein